MVASIPYCLSLQRDAHRVAQALCIPVSFEHTHTIHGWFITEKASLKGGLSCLWHISIKNRVIACGYVLPPFRIETKSQLVKKFFLQRDKYHFHRLVPNCSFFSNISFKRKKIEWTCHFRVVNNDEKGFFFHLENSSLRICTWDLSIKGNFCSNVFPERVTLTWVPALSHNMLVFLFLS